MTREELKPFLEEAKKRYNKGDRIQSIFSDSQTIYQGDAEIYISSSGNDCGIVCNDVNTYLYYHNSGKWSKIVKFGNISQLEEARRIIYE